MFRNMGIVEGQKIFSDNSWEQVRERSDTVIKAWIDKELDLRSCVIVLIGSETHSRRWDQYEIEEAWRKGKGIVGVCVYKLKNELGAQSTKGINPFEQFWFDKTFKYIANRSKFLDKNEAQSSTICEVFDSPFRV